MMAGLYPAEKDQAAWTENIICWQPVDIL